MRILLALVIFGILLVFSIEAFSKKIVSNSKEDDDISTLLTQDPDQSTNHLSNKNVKSIANFIDKSDNSSNPIEKITESAVSNVVNEMNKIGSSGNILSGVFSAFSKVFGLFGKIREKQRSGANETETVNYAGEELIGVLQPLIETDLMAQSIKKEHVCTREKIKKGVQLQKSVFSLKYSCDEFLDAVRCTTRKSTNQGLIETTRIQECCEGFKANIIRREGCQEIVDMKSTLSILEAIPIYKQIKENELLDEFKKKDLTFFMPNFANISEVEQKKLMNKQFLENHLVNGIHNTYDYNQGDVIKTIGNGIIIINERVNNDRQVVTFANCVPISAANLRTTNGLIHGLGSIMKETFDTIMQSLKNNNLNRFISLLSPELQEKLSNKTEKLTVFAFTDEAFDKLPKEMQDKMKSSTGCGKNIMENHIFLDWKCSFDLSSGSYKSLVGNESIDIYEKEINGVKIISSDHVSLNGVLHIVDDIIVKERLESWEEFLNDKPLTKIIKESTDNSSEGITIFVPKGKLLNKNNILYHTLPIMKDSIIDPLILHTAANTTIFSGNNRHSSSNPIKWSFFDSIYADNNDNNDTIPFHKNGQIGCSRLIDKSVRKCSAVIHFIDKPLPSSGSFEDILKTRKDISKMYNILKKSSEYSRIKSLNLSTLFIPVNDGFSNNQYKNIISSQDNIDHFIKFHMPSEALCEFDLPHSSFDFVEKNGKKYIQDAEILENEIFSNGVIYIIDGPLSTAREESLKVPILFSPFNFFNSNSPFGKR